VEEALGSDTAHHVRTGAAVVGVAALVVACVGACAGLAVSASTTSVGSAATSTATAGSVTTAVTTGVTRYGNPVDPGKVAALTNLSSPALQQTFVRDPQQFGIWLSKDGSTILNGCHRVSALVNQVLSGKMDSSTEIPVRGGTFGG